MTRFTTLSSADRIELIRRISASTDTTGECWLWQGTIQKDGYGQIHFAGRTFRVHRVVLENECGELADDQLACHRCDVRRCVRPAHLFAGTVLDNARDAVAKGRYATGLRQGMNTHPEARARGLANGRHTRPERGPVGELHGMARLREVEVRIIRLSAAAGISTHELARTFGVSRRLISKIVDRELWRNVA